MDLKFVEGGTIFDVRAFQGRVDADSLFGEFTCKFVDVYSERAILITGDEIINNLEVLANDHILAFNFFRGAYGYKFSGRIATAELVEKAVLLNLITDVEQFSRRKAPRVDIFIPVSIFAATEGGIKDELITTETSLDISRGGLSVVTNNKLGGSINKEDSYFLDFMLDGLRFSILSKLVHSGKTSNLFSYKFVHAFQFQGGEHDRLSTAMFGYNLKARGSHKKHLPML